MTQTLAGLRIGVTGARKGAQLAQTLARRGAEVVHGPTLEGDVAAAGDELAEMVERVIAIAPTIFAASTGTGMRLLARVATEQGRDDELGAALRGARVLARGAKARGGLGQLQVGVDWTAPDELDRQVADEIRARVGHGDRVVVQAHGAGGRAYDRLAGGGLDVTVLRPYVSAPLSDPGSARELVAALADGRLDVVVFTSPGAVHGLADVARDSGHESQVATALGPDGAVAVVAVGPVTSAAVSDEGWLPRVVPATHRTGAMIRALESWASAPG